MKEQHETQGKRITNLISKFDIVPSGEIMINGTIFEIDNIKRGLVIASRARPYSALLKDLWITPKDCLDFTLKLESVKGVVNQE